MKRIGLSLCLAVWLFSACTTIQLRESEAFDVKRSIRPDDFKDTLYTLEEIEFQSGDTLVLNGWFIKNSDSRGTVLYFGGNGFVMVTARHIIESIIQQGVDLMLFDYRGYGRNPGTPTVAGLKQDGLSAYDFLIQRKGIDAGDLVLHGHSMGSFIATFVADERKTTGVILESPITDARDWTGRLVPALLKPFIRFDIDPALAQNSNIERLSAMNIPLLLVVGDNDQVTPASMAKKLYKAAASEDKKLVVIENGGHNDLPQRKEYKDALRRFYQKSLK